MSIKKYMNNCFKKIVRWKILSFKNVVYGKNRVRRNYSKVKTNVELPNLIEIQTKSFDWFLNEGIKELFKEISPIKDYSEKYELYFDDYEFDEPKYDIPTAKRKDANYSRALKASVKLVNNETGEIIAKKDGEDKIYLGDFPVMTPWGTFVINGAERVIVTQIIRSAGVFFSKEVDKKSGRSLFAGQVIPTRGVWIEYEMGSRDIWYAKLDRSKKIPLTTFLRAVGLNSNKEITKLFGTCQFMKNTFEKDDTFGSDDALEELYDKLKPGEKSTPDGAAQDTEVGTCHEHKVMLALGKRGICLAAELNLVVLNPLMLLAELIPVRRSIHVLGKVGIILSIPQRVRWCSRCRE